MLLLPFLCREPLTGKLPESLRGKISIGGSARPAERHARAIWKKAVSVRFPWAPHPQRSDRLNSRCRRIRLDGMSLQCPPAQSVFHNTFRFIGYIRTGGTIAAGQWGWALCFSIGPGYFSMPEVRCKLYNTCFPFTALFSPGRVFYQHMRERPDFFCFLTTVKIQLKFCCFG